MTKSSKTIYVNSRIQWRALEARAHNCARSI